MWMKRNNEISSWIKKKKKKANKKISNTKNGEKKIQTETT